MGKNGAGKKYGGNIRHLSICQRNIINQSSEINFDPALHPNNMLLLWFDSK